MGGGGRLRGRGGAMGGNISGLDVATTGGCCRGERLEVSGEEGSEEKGREERGEKRREEEEKRTSESRRGGKSEMLYR